MFNREKFKRLRVISCLSQKELAKDMGIHHQTVGYWEKGSFEPSPNMLKRIADYFKIEPAELIKE